MRYCREFTQPATAEDSGEHLGLSLDLDPPAGIEVLLHDDQCRRWIDVAKELAVSAADCVPVRGIGDIHPRSHHVFTRPTEGLDRLENDFEAARCLHVGVTLNRFTVTVDRRGERDRDARSPANGTRKADQTLVRGRRTMAPRTRRIVLCLHVASLYSDERPGQGEKTTPCGAGSKPVACGQWKYPATPPVSRRERSTYRW